MGKGVNFRVLQHEAEARTTRALILATCQPFGLLDRVDENDGACMFIDRADHVVTRGFAGEMPLMSPEYEGKLLCC